MSTLSQVSLLTVFVASMSACGDDLDALEQTASHIHWGGHGAAGAGGSNAADSGAETDSADAGAK